MQYGDLHVANLPRFRAREIMKLIRTMSPGRRETLATRIQLQAPLLECNPEMAGHVVGLLQGRRPKTSLETLLRETQNGR